MMEDSYLQNILTGAKDMPKTKHYMNIEGRK